MATYTPTANTKDAIEAAEDAIGSGSEYTGMCEKFTRTCYGFSAAYGSANEAYQASKNAGGVHSGSGSDAPPGSVMFWDITYGTNAPYDHVAPVTDTGVVCSTSAGPNATVARVKITDLTARWGMTPRGWTTIYHGVHLFTSSDPDDGGDDEMKYRGYARSDDQSPKNGEWHTLKITDENDYSMTFDSKPFHAQVQVYIEGLPVGEPAQIRFKQIDVKSGEDSVRVMTYPISEIVGTTGGTMGSAQQYGIVHPPKSGWDRRVRAEILVYEDGVKVTQVQARSFQ